MDERPNLDESEDPGAQVDRFVHPDEKRRPGGLVGETAGDALRATAISGSSGAGFSSTYGQCHATHLA
jgi:hypothetical protein